MSLVIGALVEEVFALTALAVCAVRIGISEIIASTCSSASCDRASSVSRDFPPERTGV
jgi:hypothetical protein